MIELILAAIFFIASHFGIASTGLRPRLITRLGSSLYLGLYTAIAFIAIFWLVSAYRRAVHIDLWIAGPLAGWLTLVMMLIACLLFIAGLTTANPTAVGQAMVSGKIAPPSGIIRVTRHPMLWSFALWALAHLLVNGDAASLILFGSIALLALIGTRLIDARYEAQFGAAWRDFSRRTSNLPFIAILGGRQRASLAELGWWRPVLALVLFALLLALHAMVIGVPLMILPR